MPTSQRDRISVDVQGLKAALFDRARAEGTSPSAVIRRLLADHLGLPMATGAHAPDVVQRLPGRGRHRLSLRMTGLQAEACVEAASRAGMTLGDYVAGLVAKVPVLTEGARPAELLAVLTASCSELSSLRRAINLLPAASSERPMPAMLDSGPALHRLAERIASHLRLTSAALAELRPQALSNPASGRRGVDGGRGA